MTSEFFKRFSSRNWCDIIDEEEEEEERRKQMELKLQNPAPSIVTSVQSTEKENEADLAQTTKSIMITTSFEESKEEIIAQNPISNEVVVSDQVNLNGSRTFPSRSNQGSKFQKNIRRGKSNFLRSNENTEPNVQKREIIFVMNNLDYKAFPQVKKVFSIPKPQETNATRLTQRQKQINFGKATVGYKRYISLVRVEDRTRKDPQTPDKYQVCSKRSWDGQVIKWRRQLHLYDPPKEEWHLWEDFNTKKNEVEEKQFNLEQEMLQN